jgi:molybdopterin converting factor small subunit
MEGSSEAINVTVRYYNLVMAAVGKRSETISVRKGMSLRELLIELALRYGDHFREMILDDAHGSSPSIAPYARAFLDGEAVSEGLLEKPLSDNAEVSLFMAVSGG